MKLKVLVTTGEIILTTGVISIIVIAQYRWLTSRFSFDLLSKIFY
ncbi:protein of unknown function [Candidatus Nitrosocosmicus franklandus]|uniref:Uncharacterized protein n=1 Tax=Candidatus Nitrosocosmicus franklandianus TaxID=1798806 RepID=A0A484I8I4_9ARCH|nr:protein of unknown function [Candidatus Nitrosocosmicus franklandus]